ncbi:MAG: hypothetical protein J0H74_18055 [Chitinophagaceae bacterium]|nr:hypothetical protein [Chitinophagaceae bacterium]
MMLLENKKNTICAITEVIPQSHIVVFSPHFDDVLFMLGGYISELKRTGTLHTKKFHINLLFSKSNYLARSGRENFNKSLERIKFATGQRLLEDQECIDEMLGKFNYRYEILGESECFTRGKKFADSEMEFPHGMYEDFDDSDKEIFRRMKERIRSWAACPDTALIFPIAFKEHIDHFIVREAAVEVAKELNGEGKARFYFQEDKPYGGIATENERQRIDHFISTNALECRTFRYDPEHMITLAFKHYITQVEEVYKIGIRNRAKYLEEVTHADGPCDRIYLYDNGAL